MVQQVKDVTGHASDVTESDDNSKLSSFSYTRNLSVLFISLLLDLVAFTVILPLLPSLLDYYGSHDTEGSLYFSFRQAVGVFRGLVGAPDTPRWNAVLFGGVLGSMFSFLQYLTSPVIGAVSDFYGRKPVMIISSIGIALSYVVWAVSHNFTVFVIARVIGGISKGNISLSVAIISDVTPPNKRAKGMALVGVAFSIGFVVGPLIGAYFSQQARLLTEVSDTFFTLPALFALTLATLNIVFLGVCLQETLPADKRADSIGSGFQRALPLVHPVMLFRFTAVKGCSLPELQRMQQISIIYFLYLFIFSGLEFTLTFLTHNRFDFNSMQQGKMFLVIGVVMILVQGGFVRRVKSGKELSFAVVGMIVLIPSFIVIAYAHQQSMLYVGLVLFSFAAATVPTFLTAVASSFGTVKQKGTVLGIFRSLGALARAFGPVIASFAYWSVGPVYCYVVGAVALMVPLLLLTRIKQHIT